MSDDGQYDRLNAIHQRDLEGYSEFDPKSPCYQRPDLAAKYRAQREADFETFLTQRGISKPAPKTPEQQREAHFNRNWSGGGGMPEGQMELIDGELEKEKALDPADRARNVAALKKRFGEADYDRMVADARDALKPGETMPDAALSNAFVLQNLAAIGKYTRAYEQARSAAGLR